MKRIFILMCLAILATAAYAAGETIELPDGTTMDVLYPGVDGVSRPVAKKNDRIVPEYPRLVSPLHAESAVVFAVLVDANGEPVQLIVRDATHPGIGFEDAAADALLRWKFEPAILDGQPVASYTNIRVRFPDLAKTSRSSLVGSFPTGAAGGGSAMAGGDASAMFGGGRDSFGHSASTDKGRLPSGQATPSSVTPGQTLTRATVPGVSQGQMYFKGHPEWGYRRYNGPPPGNTNPR